MKNAKPDLKWGIADKKSIWYRHQAHHHQGVSNIWVTITSCEGISIERKKLSVVPLHAS